MLIGISGKSQSGKDLVGNIIQYLYDRNVYGIPNIESEYDFGRYMSNSHNLKSYVSIKKFATIPKKISAMILNVDVSDFEKEDFKNKTMPNIWWFWDNGIDEPIPYLSNTSLGNNGYKLVKYTYRDFLQRSATDAMRDNVHTDIWINALFSEFDRDSKWVITDVRFKNELYTIKRNRGIVIKVNSPEFYYLDNKTNSVIKSRYVCNEEYLSPLDINSELVQNSKYFHKSEKEFDNYTEFDYIVNNDSSINDLIRSIKNILLIETFIK